MSEEANEAPKRIQLRRTKGWRKPEGAVVVARPSKWGNWCRVVKISWRWRVRVGTIESTQRFESKAEANAAAVAMFRDDLEHHPERIPPGFDLSPLRGRDLACWCPLDHPCHADVLLDLANRPDARGESA